jgi:AraC-like DNA-binding protein
VPAVARALDARRVPHQVRFRPDPYSSNSGRFTRPAEAAPAGVFAAIAKSAPCVRSLVHSHSLPQVRARCARSVGVAGWNLINGLFKQFDALRRPLREFLIPRVMGVLMDAMLLTHRPGPPLSHYVEALWYYDGQQTAHHKERVLPTGRFQIVIDLSVGPGAVCGMRSQCIIIEPAAIQSVMGVVFRPGGARGFLAVPASDFYNQVVPLDAIWGAQVTQLRDRLREVMTVRGKVHVLETTLLQAMQRGAEERLALHPSVQYALGAFRHVPHIRTVIDIARDAGLSRRRLSQLFREQVGMTPKLYCRLIRFRAVMRQIATGGPVDWADVAVAGGYFDQAHLAHEFRDFSGISPGRYLAAERPFPNHVRID